MRGRGVQASQWENLSSRTHRTHSWATARALPNVSTCSASLQKPRQKLLA